MSGHSGSTDCPNCGAMADEYSDWKPLSYSIITCFDCGLIIEPNVNYMNLEELNERRDECGLDSLKELPEQKKDVW